MEKLLKGSSEFLEVSVNKYDDLLILDCADLSVFKRFSALYENVEKIAADANADIAELGKKHSVSNEITVDVVNDYVDANINFSKRVMGELDGVFGAGFTGKVYSENYEINPEFVPDEIALVELMESLIPIMEKAYGERIKRNKSKYNAGKRGKHNKTKQQLLDEQREMMASE